VISEIFKNKSDLLKHVLSLSASLAINAVLLYFMATHFVSVKIIDFKEQVTDIIIAPRPRLEAPKIEGTLPELPQRESDLLEFLPTRRPGPRLTGESLESTTAAEEASGSSPALPLNPKFTSGFRLDKQPEGQAEVSSDRLRLTVPERKPGTSESLAGIVSGRKAGDLRKYVYTNPSGGPGVSIGIAAGRRTRNTPSRSRAVPPSVLKIDLSPWARTVVELIQKNWAVPAVQESSSDTSVEIAVVILKSGAVTHLEVVSPSDDREFDLAAREAIETSSPLPQLPNDFPADSLEISLIFFKQ
jgi:TonB family protein